MTDPQAASAPPAPVPASPVVLHAQNVHVVYRTRSDRRPRLRDRLARGAPSHVEVDAVKGVSLEVREGECLGIIGGNGAGKSSLLRAMAGLQPVSRGHIKARSRPVILGVGAALRADLSGRRNIHLGCLALGMAPAQVRAQLDEIVAFTGLSDAIDLPMRTYSSGMRARLHFAIATAVVPDLLLIDEALAVGDAEFRDRSRARIGHLLDHAGAVVLVSHSQGDIVSLCSRALLLEEGQIIAEGDPEEVFATYARQAGKPAKQRPSQRSRTKG